MTRKTFAGMAALAAYVLTTTLTATPAGAQAPTAVLTIQADQPVHAVSPTLYGLMTEEINYSYDGGLYAEMVRNRTFRGDWSGIPYWYLVEDGNATAKMAADPKTGPSEALPNSLRLDVEQADAHNRAGILNVGWWGMAVRPGTTYKGSFYAKAGDESMGPVTVSLVGNDSGKTLAEATIPAVSTEWKQYEFTLKAGAVEASANNHLVIAVGHAGSLWLNLVSLFPPTYHHRANGNRVDLMEKLAAMHPAFLRFPGGNFLEGDHIKDRYEWKKTIGPLVDRPTHPSPWHYQSSDGLGLLEFLGWCEDLKMQPVLAVYAGYSLAGEHVDPGPALEPYVQNALEELEYVTGGTDTKWGAIRAKDGHPAPFKLTYVEIGNEDQFDKSGSYEGRYEQFYKAIKAKYPELQLIATAPLKDFKPDVQDDHFYVRATENFHDATHYDKADRSGPKIFVGEWATREGAPTPNFGATLGDAAWMTGLERNSDLVIMSSYAPLLVNVDPGGMQWETDLIGYNAMKSYGSPSYYAQVMFAEYLGDHTLETSLKGAGKKFFYSITRSAAKKQVYLKLVNAASTPQKVEIALKGAQVAPTAKLVSLTAKDTQATNSIHQPTFLEPVSSMVSDAGGKVEYTMPAYAIQVLVFDEK
ncbi:MAG TPA: alpha-L-arabinofuranosidase C-terminal domain-containing protein [Terracidiphilus sp.]|nr:alpha-L-arabinofuranosidase C-terminal domain-containing protein [Terracidiphilus sp.]